MAPLLTLARQAATYQAGIPTQSCREGGRPLSPGPGAGHHRKARPGLTHGVRRANAEQDSEAGTRLTASARFPLYNDLGPRKVRPAGGVRPPKKSRLSDDHCSPSPRIRASGRRRVLGRGRGAGARGVGEGQVLAHLAPGGEHAGRSVPGAPPTREPRPPVTSSQDTTVGPSHCANGSPFLRASSSSWCLVGRGQQSHRVSPLCCFPGATAAPRAASPSPCSPPSGWHLRSVPEAE